MPKSKLKVIFIILVIFAAIVIMMKRKINLGLDLKGGSRIVLEAQDTPAVKVDNNSMLGVIAVVRNRVNGLGVGEIPISRKGFNQVVVELPGIKEPERALKLIGETALLEFVEAEWAPEGNLTKEQIETLGGKGAYLSKVQNIDSNGNIIDEKPIILKKTVLTGADLKIANPGTDQYGKPIVNIEFTKNGTQLFREVTSRNVGKPLAILLDKKVISAPKVNEPIPSGKAYISGSFTVKEMHDLVVQLKAGSLPVPLKVVENKIVGPTLGKDSLEKSKIAGIIGFVLVVSFMLFYYRYLGLLADLALVIYVLLTLASLNIINATLTLPGIAGLILSIGMAVDANVLIFERIKEEIQLGKTLKSSIDAGFHRAWTTIIDSNVTTLITAVALFWLGTGSIKGFAVTLSLGILISMFSAVFVTRVFVDGFSELSAFRLDIERYKTTQK